MICQVNNQQNVQRARGKLNAKAKQAPERDLSISSQKYIRKRKAADWEKLGKEKVAYIISKQNIPQQKRVTGHQ